MIDMDGTGGNSGINASGSAILAEGNVTLSGEGTSSDGINLSGSPVTSNTGTIELDGTGKDNGIFVSDSAILAEGNITLKGTANANNGIGINIVDNASLVSNSGEISLLGNTINLDSNTIISAEGNVNVNSAQDVDTGITSLGATVNITADTLFLKDTIEFSYNIAETRFDTINVTGGVNIENASLDFDVSKFNGTSPAFYTLINNDGIDSVTGTFNGLSEGALVSQSNGFEFYITYQGDSNNLNNIGSGNDVRIFSISRNPVTTRGTGNPDSITAPLARNIIDVGGGNDIVQGNIFEDTILGGSGNDTLLGNNGDDLLNGGSGNDTLNGGNGNDIILAGSGNDTLIGGMDNDTLTGGSGNDFFRFNSSTEEIDRITDFNVIEDKIGINASGFGGGLMGGVALTSHQFRSGAGVTTANSETQRFIYNTSTGALFFDVDGDGAGVAIQIATLGNRSSLTNQSFTLI